MGGLAAAAASPPTGILARWAYDLLAHDVICLNADTGQRAKRPDQTS